MHIFYLNGCEYLFCFKWLLTLNHTGNDCFKLASFIKPLNQQSLQTMYPPNIRIQNGSKLNDSSLCHKYIGHSRIRRNSPELHRLLIYYFFIGLHSVMLTFYRAQPSDVSVNFLLIFNKLASFIWARLRFFIAWLPASAMICCSCNL